MANLYIPVKPDQIIIDKVQHKAADDMPYMHFHPCYELYFLISGERRYFIGHTIYDVAPGDVVLIPRNEIHQTTALHNKGYDRYVMYFYEDSIRELSTALGEHTVETFFQSGCFRLPWEHSEMVRKTLEQIVRERSQKDRFSDAMVKNLLHQILLCIFRYGTKKSREKSENTDKIQEVARYISENYASHITLDHASRLAFMEKTYFSKQFKKLTGFGFHEYLIQTRLKAAEEQLRLTKLSISEISEQCGFSGSNYFGDVFHRWKGMSPTEYRKLHV